MAPAYTPKTIAPILFKRLTNILADKNTGSIQDTDLFKSSRDFLMTLTGSGLGSDMVFGCVQALQDIIGDRDINLDSINNHDLSLVLELTRLLSDIVCAEWDAAVAALQMPVPEIGRPRDREYMYNGMMKFYVAPPPELDPEVAAAAISLFTRIRSTTKLNHTVHHVLSQEIPPDQRSPNHARHNKRLQQENSNAAIREFNQVVTEIDNNCENIIFFLSASNWNETYSHCVDRLKNLRHVSSDEVDAIPGLDVLGLLYLDHERVEQVLRDLGEVYYPAIRRGIHRLVVMYYLYKSLMYWIMARGSDVIYGSNDDAGSELTQVVDPLFDYIYKHHADSDKKSHTCWTFLSVLLVLMPESFAILSPTAAGLVASSSSISSASEKVRRTKSNTKLSNKKLHFMDLLSRAWRSPSTVDRTIAATSYLTFCKAAASICQIDAGHPIVVFATGLYRDLLNALFGSVDRQNIYSNLDTLQSQFVSAFCFLLLQDVLTDLMPVVKAATAPVRYQRNIIRGLLNLHSLPSGRGMVHEIASHHQEEILGLIIMVSNRYRDYELGGLVRNDPIGYDQLIHTCKLTFLLVMSQPTLYYSSQIMSSPEIITAFIEAVILGTVNPNIPLRETTMAFCFDIIESDKLWHYELDSLSKESPGHVVLQLFRAFGVNARQVAYNVMHNHELNDSRLEFDLRFIKRYLQTRTEIINTYKLQELSGHDASKLEPPEERLAASRTIETCVLVCLCSSNVNNCKMALQIIHAMTQEALAAENFDKVAESCWSIMPNFNIYSELASPTYVVTGPIAVQKRLFKWLQIIDDPSPAMVKAWAIVYDRWIMISVASFDSDQDKQREWKSYSGFLCSLLSPLLNLDGQVRIPDNAHFKARQFLKELIELLLLSDSPYARETVKEVLARDASPLVFHHVFQHLNDMIDQRLTVDRTSLDPKDTRLAVQTTSLITSVIERLYDGEVYLSVDIGALALKIVRFLKGVESNTEMLKLEIRICQLLEVVGFYKDTLNMKHELRVRNEFVMILSEWLEEATAFIASNNSHNNNSSSDKSTDRSISRLFNERDRLVKDKTVAIVKALTQLLDGLAIDVPDDVHEKDIVTTKSNIFNNLFSLFLRVLNRLKIEEEGRNEEGILQLGDRVPFVRNQVILALSNLLNANVDVGLKIALNLGYHDDLNLRLAFLEIFKNILTQGTKFSAEYNESKKFEELVDIVVSNRQIALMLCDACPPSEVDDFSLALLNVFDSRNLSLALVKDVVVREIENSDSPADILRRNCVATKLLSLYARSKGFEYLQMVIGPFLYNITNYPEQFAFEIEPEKLKDYQEFKDNLNNFEKCLTEIINSLERSVSSIPSVFREVCHTIQSTVEPLFPEAKESAVSSFFFLRFLCPALVSPDGEGLLDKPPSKQVRRSLLLLAKIIQNMANGSTNPVRLSVVSDRITMIEQKTETMLRILKQICNFVQDCPFDTEEENESSSTASRTHKSLERTYAVALHKYLYSHWEDAHHRILMDQRMRKLLASRSNPGGSATHPRKNNALASTAIENRRRSSSVMGGHDGDVEASRRLTSIIRSLGRPSSSYSRQLPTNLRFKTPHRLYEFMSRNSVRDISPVVDKKIVHEGVASDGIPMLVMTGRNYNRDQTDTELVLYRFFQVASKMWSDKFYLFYDGTGYSPLNALPTNARSASDIMIPDEMAHNCAGMYFYNVSSMHLPRVKALVRHYQNGLYLNPMRTPYKFLTTKNVGEHFNISGLNLDDRSVKVINDARLAFYDVTKVLDDREENISVSIHLGNEYLQVHGEQPFNFVPHSPGYTNDAYHLTEIGESYLSDSSEGHGDKFTIELIRGHKKLVFLSSKRHEIIRAIQNAKSRLSKEEAEICPRDTVMRVEDSLGRLLNLGLANLCALDSSVQLAAYNLLATLPIRFDIDFGRELRGGEGLAIPKNEVTMAVSFSEAVSLSHPTLTLEFLNEFFSSYKNLSVERRQSTILYAVPWIKNIYKHVFLADEEKGAEHTAALIRNCLDITVGNPGDYTCLLLNVWPVLSLDDSLAEILIEEVVEYVVARGLHDSNVEETLAIITSFPTMTICGRILHRIRKLLNKPQMGSAERSLVSHPNWAELVVLVKMMSFLSFESITIAEVFLPDICMLVTTFLYTGSYSFRVSLHALLVNVVHSFSCSPNLTADRKEHVVNIWHDLCSAKGKLLFGLSDEMRPMNYDYFVLAAVKHIESCCMILLDILSAVGSSPDDANVWRARWSTFVMKSCFVECPALQCRSFLVLGCLARIEVEDMVVTQVLLVLKKALASEMLTLSEEYAACSLFCLAKMVDGLPSSSKYHTSLFWLALSILRTSTPTLFGYAISLLTACIRAMDDNGAFKTSSIAEHLMSGRTPIEEEWKELDAISQIEFSVEYFDVAICAVICRGIERSVTRASTLKALETFLEICAKNNVKKDRQCGQYPPYLCYLYFLYLGCRSDNDLKDLLWVVGYPEDHLPSSADAENIPTLLKEFLSDDSTDSTITLFLGGQLFRSSTEYDSMDLRFLKSLRVVGERNVEKKAMVYSMIRDKILRIVDQGSNSRIMEAVLNVGGGVLANVELFSKLPTYRRRLQSLLIGSGFEGTLMDMQLNGSVFTEEEQLFSRERFAALVGKMVYDD